MIFFLVLLCYVRVFRLNIYIYGTASSEIQTQFDVKLQWKYFFLIKFRKNYHILTSFSVEEICWSVIICFWNTYCIFKLFVLKINLFCIYLSRIRVYALSIHDQAAVKTRLTRQEKFVHKVTLVTFIQVRCFTIYAKKPVRNKRRRFFTNDSASYCWRSHFPDWIIQVSRNQLLVNFFFPQNS